MVWKIRPVDAVVRQTLLESTIEHLHLPPGFPRRKEEVSTLLVHLLGQLHTGALGNGSIHVSRPIPPSFGPVKNGYAVQESNMAIFPENPDYP